VSGCVVSEEANVRGAYVFRKGELDEEDKLIPDINRLYRKNVLPF